MNIYGIIPAAGKGTRLSPLPFSKELYPLGYHQVNDVYRPRPVALHLIESFKYAGIKNIFWIIAENKLDIQQFFKSGTDFQTNFCYLIQDQQIGMTDAINQVSPWLPDEDYLVCIGMPDTLFQPLSIFDQMKHRLISDPSIDIMLALYETKQWHKLGMVETQKSSHSDYEKVKIILDKPTTKPDTDLAWGAAVWRSSFQKQLQMLINKHTSSQEYTLSEAFNEALRSDMRIEGIIGDSFIDIGTIEDLQKAIQFTNRLPGEL